MSANCPVCGRFAHATEVTEYDGNYNQIYVTTYCTKCGKSTASVI